MKEESNDSIGRLYHNNEGTEFEIPIEEIFTEDFMLSCSEYLSIDQFFDDCGLVIDEEVVYEDIGSAELDAFVQANTSFESWPQMFEAAAAKYHTSCEP